VLFVSDWQCIKQIVFRPIPKTKLWSKLTLPSPHVRTGISSSYFHISVLPELRSDIAFTVDAVVLGLQQMAVAKSHFWKRVAHRGHDCINVEMALYYSSCLLLPLGWLSCYHSRFVFGKSQFQISAWRPSILTDAFRGFPQSLQANSEIVP
jgi:hypothetical protein